MAAVRISVGASSDGSMRTVFKPLVDAAKEAHRQIQTEFLTLSGQIGAIWKAQPDAAAKAFAEITQAEKKALDEQLANVRDIEKEKAKVRRENQPTEGGGPGGGPRPRGRNDGYRTAFASARYFDRAIRGAGRFAGDFARGAGVNLDIGSLVGQSVHLDKLATDLSNSGWQPNSQDAAARQRVPAAQLVAEARAAGNRAALDPTKALDGMRQFVAITGDLKSARELVGDLGVYARATGTDFEDMVSAAGEINAKLGDIPNKGQATLSVVRALAGQGKLGAIEIRQMATEMAKVGAASKMFNMAPDKAMQMMGVLMQEARQAGGAKSASVAANAAMSLVTNMTKGTTIKNMMKAGLQPWADPDKKTTLLSPETMILAALYKTKGNMGDLGGIFKDKMSMTAVRGFATVYNKAEGTPEQKLQAVRDEFSRLKKAAMGGGEMMEQFKASMSTPEAKIQMFNNKLSEIGAEIAGKVLPALERLAPTIIKGVEAFGKFVAWAAENPGAALAAALTASIARASIDTVIRAGIENLFKAGNGGVPGAGGGLGGEGGRLSKALGMAGTALTIAAAAITIEQVGEMMIDKVMKEKERSDDRSRDAALNADVAVGQGRAAMERGDTKGILAAKGNVDAQLAALQERVQKAQEASSIGSMLWNNSTGGLLSGAASWLTSGSIGTSFSAQRNTEADRKRLPELEGALKELQQSQTKMAATLTGGVLRVEVVNAGFSMADASGRSPGTAVPKAP